MNSKLRAVAAAGLLAGVVVGCNSILSNKPATIVEDEGGTEPTPSDTGSSTPPPTSPTSTDTGTPPPPPPPMPPDDAGACPAQWHKCGASCVADSDPMYGCGNATCTPCNLPHAAANCNAGACIVATCDPGFADCNVIATDGCETDLSKAATCGGCGVACPPAAPYCQPSAASFACTNGCAPTTPLLCGKDCVDPLTSTNDCGACDHKCPEVMNGTATCAAGVCGFTCRAGTHACTDHCAADSDVTQCGAACTPCPATPNAMNACVGGACTFTCSGPFLDCDMNAANGCETDPRTDPAHCGNCATACPPMNTCKAGVCTPPPDAGH
ncbi:MAG TPA: hypothetical protein VIF62_22285 [Labilithrix sp.]